jgi:2-polyprenyl-3-methyl-5-hydroxy-6-metoxy-1,4-benzoquinol methylase
LMNFAIPIPSCQTLVTAPANSVIFLTFMTSLAMVSIAGFVFYYVCQLTHDAELSIRPDLNQQLVPQHMRSVLAARGLDIDNFTPLTKQEMMAKLD